MATRRMLHKKISLSMQVDRLPLPAKLLFTWLIAHADDEGKILGDPKYIKATIVPYMNWSLKNIRDYLEKMNNEGLIYYWQQNHEWFIEFVKWNDHQTLQKDRFKSSNLPSYTNKKGAYEDTKRNQEDSKEESQEKESESKITEINISEDKDNKFADKKSLGNDPYQYNIKNDDELAAFEAWKSLESDNPKAFYTTYLMASMKGLKAPIIYQFVSEINQDSKAKKKGAIFNAKMKEYLSKKNK